MNSTRATILIVDDEPINLDIYSFDDLEYIGKGNEVIATINKPLNS